MALKRRFKPDVLTPTEDELPLNNPELYKKHNHSLYEALQEYRNVNEALTNENIILSRKIDYLDLLLTSIASLWDTLNDEVEVFTGNSEDEEVKNNFWKELLDTKLPYTTSIDGDLTHLYDNDEYITQEDLNLDEESWNRAKEQLIKENVDKFNHKKNTLIANINKKLNPVHCSNGIKGDVNVISSRARTKSSVASPAHSPSLPLGLRKSPSTSSGGPLREEEEPPTGEDDASSKVIHIFRYNYQNSRRMIQLLHEKYRLLKATVNSYKIETSRLTKQNAFLKFELKTYVNQSLEASSAEELKESVSIEKDVVPVQPVKFEDLTEDMIIGSSLYSKLFEYSKHMEKEITRLERENIELKMKIVSSDNTTDTKYFDFISKYQKLSDELSERVRGYEIKLVSAREKLLSLQEDNDSLLDETKRLKKEREVLMNNIQELDERLIKLTGQNAVMCREFAECSAKNGTDENSEIKAYKEQLMNISEELEDISNAFQDKQRFCDDLMKQLNETSLDRERLSSIQLAYTNLQDKVNKISTLCENKITSYQQQKEILEKSLIAYKNSWLHSYKRSCHLEQQRDYAYSALCEVQSQYRKSCKSQKALQTQISLLKSSSIETNLSADQSTGDVNIFKENEILRRKLTCNVCSEDFIDHCITKCGHLFCSKCINNNIKSRNRKCPQCKITFDKNDTKRIFID